MKRKLAPVVRRGLACKLYLIYFCQAKLKRLFILNAILKKRNFGHILVIHVN